MKTLRFENNGQDFSEWDLDDAGKVVGCRPFQSQIWCGCTVLDHKDLRPGDALVFRSKNIPGRDVLLAHRIREIKDLPHLRVGRNVRSS